MFTEQSRTLNDHLTLREDVLHNTAYAVALTFVHEGVFGDPKLDSPDVLPVHWGYVAEIVEDGLRARIDGATSEFIHLVMNGEAIHPSIEKHFADEVRKAQAILRILPPDVTMEEWGLIRSAAEDLITHPSLAHLQHRISEVGIERFKGQKVIAEMVKSNLINPELTGRNMFAMHLRTWKESFHLT